MTSQYRHRRTPTAGTSFPSPIGPGEIAVNTANRQIVVGDAAAGTLGAPLTLLAVRPFDIRAQYAAGEFVVQGGKLYCSKVSVTPGAFNAANWDLYSSDAALGAPTKSYVDTGDANVTTAFQSADSGIVTNYQAADATITTNYQAADTTITTNYQAADTALQTNINAKVAKAGDTMTGALTLPNGSAAAPALAFSSNTGLFGSSVNVRFTISGITRVTVSTTNIVSTLPFVLPADPTNPLESATKQYVDAQFALAPTKTYIDTQDALKVAKAGDTMTGFLTLNADPTNNLHAVTKQYVDTKPSGGASLTVSDTPPTGKPDGSLWWESDTGLLYLLYNDGNTTQWVIACPQPDLTTFALKTDLTSYVAKAGDTMTGSLIINAANPGIALQKTAANQQNAFYGYLGSSPRWSFVLGEGTAESGSNAGSNFNISRYSDAGTFLDNPLAIVRSTGLATVIADPTANLGIATKQYVDNHASPPPVAATAAEYIANSAPTKMLTPGAIWTAAIPVGGPLDTSGTITIDFNTGSDIYIPLTGAGRTMANPINMKAGQKGLLLISQDATGGRTITTWGSAWKFPGGIKPTLTTAANSYDVLTYMCWSNTFIICGFSGGIV